MKKLVMTFLVASLFVTTALSLSSCKKTDTNASDNDDGWVPTTYIIADDEPGREGAEYVICYFCHDTIWKCYDNPPYENDCFFCPTHSHIEWFDPDDDCYDPYQTGTCEYRFVRRHKHVITYTPRYHWQSWHVGGGAGSE